MTPYLWFLVLVALIVAYRFRRALWHQVVLRLFGMFYEIRMTKSGRLYIEGRAKNRSHRQWATIKKQRKEAKAHGLSV